MALYCWLFGFFLRWRRVCAVGFHADGSADEGVKGKCLSPGRGGGTDAQIPASESKHGLIRYSD